MHIGTYSFRKEIDKDWKREYDIVIVSRIWKLQWRQPNKIYKSTQIQNFKMLFWQLYIFSN